VSEVLAIYGGSFDPPHLAHTLVCAYVLSAERVDRLLVVPTAQHAFDKQLSPFEHRVRMCELAFRRLRDVEVSTIEAELPGPSLTLHTLEELQRRNPGAQLRLVLGSDLLREVHAWHRFEAIERIAQPIVVQRAGFVSEPGGPVLPEISSTEARRRVREGQATAGVLDPLVAEYAMRHGLYR
jgi:nicotinate-nucleotide adenylyltransferase